MPKTETAIKPPYGRLKTHTARMKFSELVGQFDLSCPLDVEILCQYCDQYDLYLKATGDLEKAELVVTAPNGAEGMNALIKIQSGATDQMRRLYKMLTPMMRKAEASDLELD